MATPEQKKRVADNPDAALMASAATFYERIMDGCSSVADYVPERTLDSTVAGGLAIAVRALFEKDIGKFIKTLESMERIDPNGDMADLCRKLSVESQSDAAEETLQ